MMKLVDDWVGQIDILFIANRAQLRRVAYKVLGDWDRADDVVQDAYLKICECSGQSTTVKQPLAYLFRIVRNMAIDQYRRAVFESDLFGLDEEGLSVPDRLGTPEAHAIHRQSLERVAQALNNLPERTRKVFERYRIDGYTHRMIAEELDISISLVNILIHEAARQCKSSLTITPDEEK
ncbi:MAG: sigma-70 family RNA polymerase sigma factor [Nitrosomonas sp.]|nr:MAG: sigma-70 family RNA polymerase sigma factor [Nitrosomonas sp.]